MSYKDKIIQNSNNNNNNNNNNAWFDGDENLRKTFGEIQNKIDDKPKPSLESTNSIPAQSELETKNVQIRMSKKDIDILSRYLSEEKGYRSFSTGLRWILLDFIKKNELQ